MTRLGMVIDLSRCVGCGACAFACKAENNTRTRGSGQSYNWGDFLIRTEGRFPNVTHQVMPVMCNHCSDAPCVKECKAKPSPHKAMYKTPEGITMHDPALCIGCQRCQEVCPYSSEQLGMPSLDGSSYSVISFNYDDEPTQPEWADKKAAIPGCTASGAETAAKAGAPVPAMSQWTAGDLQPIRKDGVVEKCTFCYHRTLNGLQPACVEVCPSQARIFGDQDDPKSRISQVLASQKSFRLLEEKGTKPNVHYIGKYSPRA
ncbi:4Fe-4S dicluster domain-containing protein [Ramlibacter sp. RBP-2]|uniref:4Fe-4S dicluster domain-containing protein n=1 Tax=Ramlibacter lithotrophicus TaxID=2606681 RepID=A0A7X6DJY4_9BURK|nr:4Fe-4S dicluster domain-containing protein [Ramlibacter lithotrophicus]NKE68562.1 4Fe-4S dicluster domain-containing protein [Ramlibacter lithotrophicus]